MSISTPFIKRPIATSLLTAAVAMAGALAFYFLPVAPLPQVEYPTINVFAGLPGAAPETMASAVTAPLERSFGRIAGITEMTSFSSTGGFKITIQIYPDRGGGLGPRGGQGAKQRGPRAVACNKPDKTEYKKQKNAPKN